MLRPYQQRAVDQTIDWLKQSFEPCIIDAATGAGKSHIIAHLAHWITNQSDKKVLCLAPSKELVEQNHEKYISLGEKASFFSASIGKSLRYDVIFGTPLTVSKSIRRFKGKISAVVIDEAHGITPTIKKIIEELKTDNNKLRIIGLSATPYRLNSGYIYAYDQYGEPVPESQTKEPYFNRLICRITPHELISQGYLTPPSTNTNHTEGYDTSGLTLNRMGQFDSKSVEQAFEGRGRKTAGIIKEIVELSQNRQGVIIFASTIQHAQEILESLPPEISACLTGKNTKNEREKIITDFKKKKIKYLVNVAVLTTGFDAPHVDVVAILRATESVGLLQQIVGRGLRLDKGKKDCLVLDYAENIERHCPDGDIFNPKIKAVRSKEGEYILEVKCPDCSTINQFTGRPNPDDFPITDDGYFCDLTGELITNDNDIPIPAHFGRRCLGQTIVAGESLRCANRWSSKECPDCGHHNDIAARYCEACKSELVDPNEKLRLEFKRIKSDPYTMSTDKVLAWKCQKHVSAAGNDTLKITYTTEYRTFAIWYLPKKSALWGSLCIEVYGKIAPDVDTFLKFVDRGRMPRTLTVKRERGKKFYTVIDHGRPEDEQPNAA